jgi:hypothetical protein
VSPVRSSKLSCPNRMCSPLAGLGPAFELGPVLHQPAAKFECKRDALHRREGVVVRRILARMIVFAVILPLTSPFCSANDSRKDPTRSGTTMSAKM